MRNMWIQLVLILLVSMGIGLAYNQLSKSPLPVFKKYIPDTKTDRETGEDLSLYYQEMDAPTLEALKQTDMMILLDARPPDRYLEGHIPGALSLPITTFEQSYASVSTKLEAGKTLVLYCIGYDCIDSSLLARELKNKGHQEIYVFKGGMDEWQALGLPIQTPNGIINPDGKIGMEQGTPNETENQ